jgi:flagellar biosynthesis protein FlhF
VKLEKFYAESMSQAMGIIQKKLGPDAVIYSQEKKDHLVEVVAGLPNAGLKFAKENTGAAAVAISEPQESAESFNKLRITPDLDSTHVRVQKLDNEDMRNEFRMMEQRNLLSKKLLQLKFSYDFIERFVNSYSSHCDIEEIANNDLIIKMLLSKLKVASEEFIAQKRIVALIGPTGVGKSTTLAKLAKRFISHYGNDALGIVSTDFQRIITKNQFYYFGQLLNVQVEYARDMVELQQSIKLLDDKKLILIDTAGVNQYDNKKIATLCETIQIDSAQVSLYLVLPCNLQTEALDQMVRNFKMDNTEGCIITKTDESASIAPVLSVIMNHDLTLNYVCSGQNISRDIRPANKIELVSDVLSIIE